MKITSSVSLQSSTFMNRDYSTSYSQSFPYFSSSLSSSSSSSSSSTDDRSPSPSETRLTISSAKESEIQIAMDKDKADRVLSLLNQSDFNKSELLKVFQWAAGNNYTDITQFILDHPDLKSSDLDLVIGVAPSDSIVSSFSTLIMESRTIPIMEWAADKKMVKVMAQLLECKNVNVNANVSIGGKHILEWTCNLDSRQFKFFPQIKFMKLLLTRKDVDLTKPFSELGGNILNWAAENDDSDIFKLFVCVDNMPLNLTDKLGRTPLHWALERRNEEIAFLLLEHEDIDFEIEDKYGMSPLLLAQSNRAYLSEKLISAVTYQSYIMKARLADAEKKQKLREVIQQCSSSRLLKKAETVLEM